MKIIKINFNFLPYKVFVMLKNPTIKISNPIGIFAFRKLQIILVERSSFEKGYRIWKKLLLKLVNSKQINILKKLSIPISSSNEQGLDFESIRSNYSFFLV